MNLSTLSRPKLEAIAEAKRRGLDLTPFLGLDSSLTTTQDGETHLTSEDIERERAACAASFRYFCEHYAYVTEPRPPEENEDPDEEADFQAFFAEKQYQDELSAEALALLQKDLEAAAEASGGKSTELPFALWPFQVDAARWLEWLVVRRKSGAIKKCRDMGMSWLILWFIIWCWLFRSGFQGLVGSRKEAAVDNGKLDSLFGKLDYGISKLPDWLKPKGFIRAKHRTNLSIVNPENGNFIAGDSQTEDFGRGGRYTLIFLDEYAFWDRDVWGSCRQATKTVIAGSTVNGENHFYRLVKRLESISTKRVLTMLWSDNPLHDLAWYARQQAELDEADFSREILIDFKAAIRGKYYPIAHKAKLVAGLTWQRGWPSVLSMDYGVRDDTALIWWQRDPSTGQHRMMYCYFNNNKPIDFYFPILKAEFPPEFVPVRDNDGNIIRTADGHIVEIPNPFEYSEEDLAFIQMLRDAGVRSLTYRGDPAGRNRNQDTATSIEQKLKRAGIEVSSNTKENDYKSRRSALTGVLLNCLINVDEITDEEKGEGEGGAYPAFSAIQQAKFADRREGSNSTTLSAGPVHDWTSHFRSAAEYYAVDEDVAKQQYRILSLDSDDIPEGLPGRDDLLEVETTEAEAETGVPKKVQPPDPEPAATEDEEEDDEFANLGKRKKWISSSKFIWVD